MHKSPLAALLLSGFSAFGQSYYVGLHGNSGFYNPNSGPWPVKAQLFNPGFGAFFGSRFTHKVSAEIFYDNIFLKEKVNLASQQNTVTTSAHTMGFRIGIGKERERFSVKMLAGFGTRFVIKPVYLVEYPDKPSEKGTEKQGSNDILIDLGVRLNYAFNERFSLALEGRVNLDGSISDPDNPHNTIKSVTPLNTRILLLANVGIVYNL